MWTREELKTNAKQVLKRTYWLSFAAVMIMIAIMGGLGGIIGTVSSMMMVGSVLMGGIFEQYATNTSDAAAAMAIMSMMGTYAIMYILIFVVQIFAGNHFSVGLCRYFMRSREGKGNVADVFWAFSGGRYWRSLKVMLITQLKILGWSLLLVIPGIIKTYEYRMIPYLLAENSDLPTERYFEITKGMTDDEKGAIFVLDLSFIGWIFLGALLCGFGQLFVYPYMMATDAELCALLHAKAMAKGIAGSNELIGFGDANMNM